MVKSLLLVLSLSVFACNPTRYKQKLSANKIIDQHTEIKETTSALAPVVYSDKCPANMVYVEGDWCPDLSEPCLSWGDTKEVDKWNKDNPLASKPREYNICNEFKFPTVCKSSKFMHVAFCMDVYEYPNV